MSESSSTISRRDILKSAVTLGASAIVGKEMVSYLHRDNNEPTRPGLPSTPTGEQTPTLEKHYDEGAAHTLVILYGEDMDDEYFSDEAKKFDFMKEVTNSAFQLNPDNRNLAYQLTAVMAYGTNGTFSPSFQNPINEATGIFQLTKKSLSENNISDLDKNSPIKQLDTVTNYLQQINQLHKKDGYEPMWDLGDIFMASINQQAVSENEDTPIFSAPTRPYDAYAALDTNHDNEITKGEAKEALIDTIVARYHETYLHLLDPREIDEDLDVQQLRPTEQVEEATQPPQPTDTVEATAEPTDTPQPTNPPEPTNTPEPTDTPTQEPSPTPEATDTPTPTQEPEPTSTPTPENEDDNQDEGHKLSKKEKELIKETSEHLTNLYGYLMNKDDYPTDDDKKKFFAELTKIGIELAPDNPNFANQIAAVMLFESAETFSPKVKNPNSSATGLIQFTDNATPSLGTTVDELAQMNPMEQLAYVKEYLKQKQDDAGTKIETVYDAYMAVLWPDGMGKAFKETLMQRGDGNYDVNTFLDLNHDGLVKKKEATISIIRRAKQFGEDLKFLIEPGLSVKDRENLPPPDRKAFLQAADDLKDAYDRVTGGFTFEEAGLADKLAAVLREKGYTEYQIREFESRRQRSLIPHTNPDGRTGKCSECLGWVGCVTALWGSTSDTSRTLNTQGTAGQINDEYNAGKKILVGDYELEAVPADQVQKADIAVSGSAYQGDHIGIVYETYSDNPNAFGIIESNGRVTCSVGVDRNPMPKAGYTFYRIK